MPEIKNVSLQQSMRDLLSDILAVLRDILIELRKEKP